jgi:hypothetical protein
VPFVVFLYAAERLIKAIYGELPSFFSVMAANAFIYKIAVSIRPKLLHRGDC